MSGISLIFNFQGATMIIQCQEGEKIDAVLDRYLTKSGLNPNETQFYYNGKELRRKTEKTIFALDIQNRGNINVVNSKYLQGA